MSHGSKASLGGVEQRISAFAAPEKLSLVVVLAGGIITWICLEIWLDFLVGSLGYDAHIHVTNLVDVAIGVGFAAMSITIVFALRLKYTVYFAIFVISSTLLLLLGPAIANFLHLSDWVVGANISVGVLIRSLALMAVALIFAYKLPPSIIDRLRLRMPEHHGVIFFVVPLVAWVVFNYALTQIFTAFGGEVHSQHHVVERFEILGQNAVFTIALLCTVVPLGEELFFRGFMISLIKPISNVFMAILISALLFAIMHMGPSLTSLYLPVYAFGMGTLLAATSVVAKSIWPAVLVHSVNNVLAIYEVASP